MKVERAGELFEGLLHETMAFGDGLGVDLEWTHNDDATEHYLRVVFERQPPLQRWGLIFGEMAHHLRSALDHAVYAIAVAESGVNPPPQAGSLAFPIDDPSSGSPSGLGRVAGLSEPVQQVVREAQPDPQRYLDSALWDLAKLNNVDKHRIVNMTSMRLGQSDFRLGGLAPGTETTLTWRATGVEAAEPMVTVRCTVPSPDLRIDNLNFQMLPAVDRTAWGRGPLDVAPIEPYAADLGGVVIDVLDRLFAAVGHG